MRQPVLDSLDPPTTPRQAPSRGKSHGDGEASPDVHVRTERPRRRPCPLGAHDLARSSVAVTRAFGDALERAWAALSCGPCRPHLRRRLLRRSVLDPVARSAAAQRPRRHAPGAAPTPTPETSPRSSRRRRDREPPTIRAGRAEPAAEGQKAARRPVAEARCVRYAEVRESP